MTSIYRLNRPFGCWSAKVNLTDTELTLTLRKAVQPDKKDGGDNPALVGGDERSLSISLEELKALHEFSDGAMLSFDLNALHLGEAIRWRNLFIGTLLGRRPIPDYVRNDLKWNAAVRILVPAKGITSFKQCAVMISMHDQDSELESNVPVEVLANHDEILGKQSTPTITGSDTIAVEQPETFSIQLKSGDGNDLPLTGVIYLESTAGILNKTRVTLDANGRGIFAVSAAGLTSGDTIKIKSGFRYFSGAFEKTITVV